MTKSSHSTIIKSAEIDGVVFCGPGGRIQSKEEIQSQEEDNLKALEEFWMNKGLEEGRKAGFDEGFREGEKRGFQQGMQAGLTQGKEEGDAAGYERGLEEGTKSGEERFSEPLQVALSIREQISVERDRLIEASRQELVSFAMTVCESLLRRELKDPDTFCSLVEAILEEARPIAKEGQIEIYLSAEDYASLADSLQQVPALSGVADRLQLQVERGLMQGNCRVETSMGLINFDVARYLNEMETRVLEVSSDPVEESPEPTVEAADDSDRP